MSKFCGKCGTEVAAADFCGSCGTQSAGISGEEGHTMREHDGTRTEQKGRWKKLFALIEKPGGTALPRIAELTPKERRQVRFNWLSFSFGIFYYFAKGMWRKAISYPLATPLSQPAIKQEGGGSFFKTLFTVFFLVVMGFFCLVFIEMAWPEWGHHDPLTGFIAFGMSFLWIIITITVIARYFKK